MLRTVFLISLSTLFMACSGSRESTSSTAKRPNVIVILADDLGYETVNVNGGTSYHTPEIDKMAANGIRFDHCYAQPLCTPTRVKLMTGISNVRNYVRFGLLEEHQTTFGHIFKAAGYETCIIGKWQLGKDPMSPRHAGFDEHCLWQVTKGRIDKDGRDTRFSLPILETNGVLKRYEGENDFGPRITADYGLDFIDRKAKSGEPFLLYYPMILTHCPFSPTPDSPEWAVDDTTVNEYKGHDHYFEDMMAYTDRIIGEINQKLEELGIKDNTIVLFTGDNGTDVPVISDLNGREVAGAKGKSTDAGTRVPLIVQWPDRIPVGQLTEDLVDMSDMLPTICEAADIPIPDSLDLDGISFLPQLLGEAGNPRKWIYNWYSRSGQIEKARIFARNHRYKLYTTGEFYEVPEDYLEERPLSKESLDQEAMSAYEMLSEVLASYEARRLEEVPDLPKE
ncbi:MAG: sulfatase-like hydrolase/transferase [Bacteroidota bacterium]